MPPSHAKKPTQKAKKAQEAEAKKNEPKVKRCLGRPCKNTEAPATPKAVWASPRKKKEKASKPKPGITSKMKTKTKRSSDDASSSDDGDDSDNNYRPDGDLSVNDVVVVASTPGLLDNSTFPYGETQEPDFSMLLGEDGNVIDNNLPIGQSY
ncbi:hypothetical protein ACEPAG_4103 [Sanghuangporus baumii]